MDKETLSNYGWIVICVMVLAVMLAFASPFGQFVADAVKSTTQGLFDTNQNALDSAGIEIMQQEFEEMLNGPSATDSPVKFGQPYQMTMEENGMSLTVEYVFYPDGSATMWMANTIGGYLPAGTVTYTKTEVILEGDPIKISEDGTYLYDPEDETLRLTVKSVSKGNVKANTTYAADPYGLVGLTGLTVQVGTDGSITVYQNGVAGETIPASAITWYENYFVFNDGGEETTGAIYPDGSKIAIGEIVLVNSNSSTTPASAIKFEQHYSADAELFIVSYVFHQNGSYDIYTDGTLAVSQPAGKAIYIGNTVRLTEDPLFGVTITGSISDDGSSITFNNNGTTIVFVLGEVKAHQTITITAENRHLVGYTGAANEHLVIPNEVIGDDGTVYDRIVIGYEAFMNCKNLVSITLSDNVTKVDTRGFYRCENVKQINLGNGVKSLSNYSLADTGITSITIPDNVKTISWYALECDNLQTVYIGKGLTGISAYAFYSDNKLTAIEVDPENEDYCDVDGVLYSKDMTTLIKYPNAKPGTTYVIPNSVTALGGGGAIRSTKYLEELTIPKSMETMGQWVLNNCTSIKKINYTGTMQEWKDFMSSTAYLFTDGYHNLTDLSKHTSALKVSCIDGDFCLTHTELGTCISKAVCLQCGKQYGELGHCVVVDGVCTVCGKDATVIETSHTRYPSDQNYVVLGTWNYSDAKSVTITITYQTETKTYDWVSITEGEDYIDGTSYNTNRKYIDTNGNIIESTGTNYDVKFGGVETITKVFKNVDMLTGSVIFKSSNDGYSFYGISVTITPNY